MKKFTFMLIAAFIAVAGFAQKPLAKAEVFAKTNAQLQTKAIARTTTVRKAPRKTLGLVTPPEGAVAETYYTVSGSCKVGSDSGWQTVNIKSIQVIVDGADIYIAGLAYFVPNAWIKGTIEGTTATFPSAQQVDEDKTYPEWISGSEDGNTICDVVFNFDQKAGTLNAVTPYIGECAVEDAFSIYAYWTQPSFSMEEPAAPELVELPEGVEADVYTMYYVEDEETGATSAIDVKVAVDGNDVYVQGFSSYIPEAWVKGTKDGNIVTFPAKQFVGEYYGYTSYAFYNGETVFTYDEDADTYTAEGEIYGVLGDKYYDGYYINPVIKKVIETVAVPANPEITGLENTQYGYVVSFNVPVVGTEGEELVTSKLYYMLYTDVEGEVLPLTFTPETHSKLTENMVEFPYGFTENYDFYTSYIYLNDLFSESWNKIGIQSIYTGGGELNATEIQWFDIKPYSNSETTFDFNAMDVATSSSTSTAGDITEELVLTEDNVTLTISPKEESASTPNRFWNTANGPQLRVYSGTLTFTVPEFYTITQIVFNNGKWNTGNSADSGEFNGSTWTGEAQTVVVTIAGNTQINNIVVSVNKGEVKPVEAPEGLVTETYLFSAKTLENGEEEWVDYTYQTQVGFDGDYVYINGVSNNTNEMWLKAKLSSDGKTATIPANQYMGQLSIWDYYFFDYYFTAVGEDGETMEAVVLNFDADTNTFTTDQTVVLHDGENALGEPYQTFNNIVITKLADLAATPADPVLEAFTISSEVGYSDIYASIPTKDVDGNDLLVDKLYYTVYYEKDGVEQVYTFTADLYAEDFDEDVTEIPYTYDGYDIYKGGEIIYLEETEEELKTWTKVGLQSIYYGGGERNVSNIVWLKNDNATGIVSVENAENAAAIYNLAGQRVQKAQKGGIYIVNGKKILK